MKKSILFVLGILFSFSYLQAQCDAVGGTISTMDPTTICADGNSPDPINVDLTGNMGTNSAWVITDPNGNILGLPPGPPFDLDGAGAGTCLIWHLSHEDDLTGAAVGNNAADLGGCFELSNAITVNRSSGETDGGNIATTDPTTICVGDGVDDFIDATLTGNIGTNSIWVITDDALDILALPTAPPFNFEGAGTGICLIWHLSYEDGLEGAVVGGSALDLQGCFSLSPDPIAVTRFGVNGGELATTDGTTELTICAGDGLSDAFDVNLSGTEGMNSGWVITDPNGNILGLPMAPPFDLEGAGEGVCYLWHISFQDGLEGAVVGNNAADLNGCFDLSNPIIVTRNGVNGGELATADGTAELTICAGDGNSDAFDVTLTDNEGANSAWVITDPNGNILGLPPGPPFDLEGAGEGTCYIWHLSFEDGLEGAAVGNNAADLQGCFSLSNPIIVTRNGVSGGDLATSDGATELSICAGDGSSDAFDVNLTNTEGANSAWVITDPNGNILGLPMAPPFDLEGAGAGSCYVWHISYEDGLEGVAVGNNAADLQGCFSLSNPIIVNRSTGDTDGGVITTNDPTEICAGDGIGDPIDVALSGNLGTNSAWVITDPNGNILGLPPGPPFDLDGAGEGTCYIWHLSFEDGLTGAAVGNNAADLQGCFDLSDPIIVTRNGVDGGELSGLSGNVYNRAVIANRASGSISVINTDNNTVENTYDMPDDGEPMYVVYNNSNNTVLVGDYNGRVAAFDGKTFAHTGSAEAGAGVFHMWLSPDNQQLWVNNELDKTISVIDPNTMTSITTFSIPQDLLDTGYKPHDVIVMPNNAAAFVTMLGPLDTDYVVKYSATTFEETGRAEVGHDPHVSLTSANDKLYVASQGSGEVKVLNRSDLSEVATIDVPNAHGLGMNNTGTYLYVGNIAEGGTNATYTIDLATNTLVGMPVDAPFSAPHNYAVTGDDASLFLTHSGANNSVSVYSLSPTPTLLTSLTVGNNPFGLVAYTYVETFTEVSICALDNMTDEFDVTLENATGANSGWVITDTDGNILGLPMAPPFDLDGAGAGTCLIWHISYEDGLEGAVVGNNAADLMGCFDLSNPLTVIRTVGDTDGGTITTNDPTEICAGDGNGDPIDVTLTGNIGTNSAWVITDPNGNILGLPPGPPFDLEGAGEGTCYIWHLSFEDGLIGAAVGNNAADLQGCYDLSDPIIVTRNGVNGGELATADGAIELEICAGDGNSDAFDVTLSGTEGANSAWVITDADGNILGLPTAPPFDLEGAGEGVCYVWHLSYEDGLEGVAVGNNAADLSGCFDLSNPIIVTRNGVDGGELATAGGETELTICAGDGIPDPFDVTLSGNEGTNSAWVITDPNGNILGLPAAPPFDLEGAGAGVCYVWHISFEDGLEGVAVGNNAADLDGCYSLSNPIIVTRLTGADCTNPCTVEGGDLTTTDGATELTICAGDGNSDAFDVNLSGNSGMNSGWVITDPNGNILGLPAAPPFDLEGAGEGVCYVWHISFEDGLEGVAVGNNAADLVGCFSLSNPIIVTRNGVNGGELATTDGETELTICAGDGVSDAFDVTLTDTEGANSAWVITDPNGNILGLPAAPPFDLEGAGAGVCYVWHISFEDGLEGVAVGNNAADLSGCFDLSNPIIVTRNAVNGGELATTDGETELTICAGDGVSDAFDVTLTDTEGANSAWVITDPNGNILGLPAAPPFDLEGAGAGVCYVWHISFEDGLEGVAVGNNAADLSGCFDLSNPIIVTRLTGTDCINPCTVEGGAIATADGATELSICAGDGNSDAFDVNLTGNSGMNSGWVITDPNGNILGLPAAPPFDLEGAGTGVCYVWHISFEDGLEGAAVGNNAADLEGCFDLSNPIIVTRNGVNGGELATTSGATELTICAGDGNSDEFDVMLMDNEGSNSAWVITDADGNILGLPMAPPFDLEGAGAGVCYVWHLSFEDGLMGAAVGNNAADLEGCFSLSNPIIVTRLTGADCNQGVDVELDITVDNLLYDQYEHVIYTVTVSNTGTEDATGVTVAAGLPSGMVYSDHDTDKGSYSLYFETWTVGSLAAGETATLELDLFTLVEDVDITNFVQVMTTDQDDIDSTPGNDTDQTTDEDDEAAVTITPASNGGTGTGEGDADLSLNLSVENNEYEQYEHSFWTYTVTNDGPDEATGIVVSITEPDGFKYTGDDASTGDYSDWFEEWEIPSLAAGETATLIIDFYAVTDEEVSYFTQIAIANENDPDSTPGNDTNDIADEDDEASITLTELNAFVGGNGNASTNNDSNNNVATSELAFSNLYPNPASDQITLVIGSAADLETTLQIFNLQGSLLAEQRVSLATGTNQVELNIAALPTAAYVIKLTDQDGKQQYKKFTKLNK